MPTVTSSTPPPAISFDVGAHLMEGFAGTKQGDPGVEALREKAEQGKVGGTVLFSYNIESPHQVRELTRYMLSWQVPERHRPFLVGVDQEGGKVQRLAAHKGFVSHPAPAALAHVPLEEAAASFDTLAAELSSLGIHVNFAPVVDVAAPHSVIGKTERSFGVDIEQVSTWAARLVEAHRKHGVIAAAKHFPGLGSCMGDTHADLADTTATWQRDELIPYKTLISTSGLQAVMSTHMVNTQFGRDRLPLTFERRVMHDMLRNDCQFRGVLFTDDLGMGSIVRHYDIEQVVVASLQSGHDILVFGENSAASAPGTKAHHQPIEHLYERSQQAVEDALQTGELSLSALQQSGKRVETLRATWSAR